MNTRILLHQSSLKPLHTKLEHIEASPYLKPVQNGLFIKDRKKSIAMHRKRKTLATAMNKSYIPTENTSEEEKDKEMHISKSYDVFSKLKEEVINENSNAASPMGSEALISILNEKLKMLDEKDFKGRSNAFISVFDLLIINDASYSTIISKLKEGLINSLKQKFKKKIDHIEKESIKHKENADKSKKEKDVLISKLNILSSENINLINNNDELSKKNTILEETFKKVGEKKVNLPAVFEELRHKSETIKELNARLEEMYCNEAKMIKIVDEMKKKGMDFEGMYDEILVRRSYDKKLRRAVPLLRFDTMTMLGSKTPNDKNLS
ncbi:hypothetical protein SteCoe_35593 [Stentor coeruleus]|uniref:Translin-associated factor X-interacting protein 1 N-terminal domain-containing protein n=1 Tax=Stentor coeruleus TaxID=5963 RepID=A0A1R2AS10_9CILI|nr:hypothetical protein SteCoe_35593 [Stentor coeruleus]